MFTAAKQQGQTLIEVTIAIALLAFALSASGNLATTTTRLTTESGRRSQAADLATYELEALRAHRNQLAARPAEGNSTLWEYLSNESDLTADANDCYRFVMLPDEGDTGWSMAVVGGAFRAYSVSDFSGFSAAGSQYAGYENFSRRLTLCRAEEYDAQAGYSLSNYVYDVVITVQWLEGSPPARELTYRTALSTPQEAIYD